MHVGIVVAVGSEDGAIGKDGSLPWPRLPEDMVRFRHVTCTTRDPDCRNAVIMGRKTWESLPPRARPLPGRLNVVLSRHCAAGGAGAGAAAAGTDEHAGTDVIWASSLGDALRMVQAPHLAIESAFIIGGVQCIRAALALDETVDGIAVDALYLTQVCGAFASDVALPELATSLTVADADADKELVLEGSHGRPLRFQRVDRRSEGTRYTTLTDDGTVIWYRFATYRRRRDLAAIPVAAIPVAAPVGADDIYLALVRDVLSKGVPRADRTGVGTLSTFGSVMRFGLAGGALPLLTTKRVFWRGVVEELLWFMSGSTDARVLASKGVHIWDGNSSREFLDGRGLAHRQVGDLGPVYGFQWRHFGAAYTDFGADYRGQGVDQLAAVVAALRANPTDRRIVLTAWNPVDLAKMALPPCHMFAQFYAQDGALSCLMYQRSADVGLGVPFNIASYGLLTHMVAHVTGLAPKELVYVTGDTHIYSTHVEALRGQLQRAPRAGPKLALDPAVLELDDFATEHIVLTGYDPHPALPMPMAV